MKFTTNTRDYGTMFGVGATGEINGVKIRAAVGLEDAFGVSEEGIADFTKFAEAFLADYLGKQGAQ